MIFEFDDFGCDHIISDQCQSHDCRDALLGLKKANPEFKVTLFAIPNQMTYELLEWSDQNRSWVELAVHGFTHHSNYECEKMSHHEFDTDMVFFEDMIEGYFVKGFRAPGWQISNDCYEWLENNEWWVADQSYNNQRRPRNLPAYVNNNGVFEVRRQYEPVTPVPAWHGHTWNCMGNGIYETYELLEKMVSEIITDFKFVSEVI